MFKKISFLGILFLAVVLAGACVAARGVVLNVGGPVRPAVAPADVRVFLSGAEVPGPFEVVGLLTGRGSDFTKAGKILVALKDRAAKMGANGIILEKFKGATLGTRAASFLVGFGGLAPKKWRATAISFKSVD
jgi:hypothetical protein